MYIGYMPVVDGFHHCTYKLANHWLNKNFSYVLACPFKSFRCLMSYNFPMVEHNSTKFLWQLLTE